MYQLSQSIVEPPPSETVQLKFSDGTSQCWRARLPSFMSTRYGLRRLAGGSG